MSTSAATAPTTRYRARQALTGGPDRILWKEVDEGWVRFDPAAGQTLLLTPISRFVLDALSGAGRSVDALVDAALHEEPDADPGQARELVCAALDALTAARLIQPVP